MTANSHAHAVDPAADGQALDWPGEDDFIRLIQTNSKRVKRYLRRAVCDDDCLIEDAVQEALIVAIHDWRKASTFHSPLSYIRRVAHNKLIDMLRKQASEVIGLDEIDVAAPDAFDLSDSEEALDRLFRRLPTRRRQVLALAAEGVEDDEIGRELGLARSTVRTYKSEARRLLKGLAGEADYDEATRRRM